jgi:hypothetical protein
MMFFFLDVCRYFPLFIFGHGADPAADSMVSMPMSAPAAVPDEEGESEEVEPTDACEMMLCTTKQKKRKGVSCGCSGYHTHSPTSFQTHTPL